MTKLDTFTPSKELRDYYERYHRGETDSPLVTLRGPSDFDFPCSADWRDYYEERYGGSIDFPVSSTYARHYRSIGLMPALAEENNQPRLCREPSRPRDWLNTGMALIEAHQRQKPVIKGVLR